MQLSFTQNQDQRTLEMDTAMAMMNLLLHGSWSLLDDFLEFLQVCYQGQWYKGNFIHTVFVFKGYSHHH